MHMLGITVGEVLELEVFQSSQPELISYPLEESNDAPVRWMHILETARPEGLLPGGEFILTTATFFDQVAGERVAAANQFLDTVEATGAVAVAAEILKGRQHVIEALTVAALHRTIPIYILHRRVRFIEITQHVHEAIAAARLQEVETDRRIHETFTKLSVGSASIDRIISEATTLLGCRVAWESSEQQSEAITIAEHTVVAGDETLGRLIITDDLEVEESFATTVLERAGQAVSISVLAKRSQRELRNSMASSLFYQLRGGTELSEQEIHWRVAQTFGLPIWAGEQWWPVVFQIWNVGAGEEALNRASGVLLDILQQVGTAHAVPIFAARSEIGVVDVLLPLNDVAIMGELIETTRARFIARLRGHGDLVAGIGTETTSVKAAAEQLTEAAQIARTAQAYEDATRKNGASYYFARDLGLHGLLATLRKNRALVSFVASQLSGLLRPGRGQQAFEQQLKLVELILSGTNKAALARSLHLSRPALYARIDRLEGQLGYRLEHNAELRVATQVAAMAYWLNPDHMYTALEQRVSALKPPQ